ncbi:MAG: hypothetical protein ACE5KV_06045, partial [Thermoplasmata archaeon]
MLGTTGMDVEARESYEPNSTESSAVVATYMEGEVIVLLEEVPGDRDSVADVLERHGGSVSRWMLNPRRVLVQVDPGNEHDFIKSIEDEPTIEDAGLNYIHELALKPSSINDDFWNRDTDDYWYQYAPRYINANYAWRKETGSKNIRICDFDTGINRNHVELIDNYQIGGDFVD